MKRYLKLSGFVLIGLICALVLCLLQQCFISFVPRASATHRPAQDLFSFLFTSQFSFFFGSVITGYLCSQHIKTKRGFIWITPGLYFLVLETAIFIHYADSMLPGIPEAMLLFGILTFLVSWAGVGVSHYIRREILKPST
jgi:Na+-driven multidrug efflux pump